MSTTEPTLERTDASGPLQRAAKFGGTVGLGIVFVGVVIIFLGWNGAASFGNVAQQFPYLISGGMLGLGVMVVGSAMVVVENQRKDRSAMQASISELRETLEKLSVGSSGPATAAAAPSISGASDLVVAGDYDYVAADSLLAEGREGGQVMTRAEAEAAGLVPSRVDFPDSHDIPATKEKQAAEKAARVAAKAARNALAIPAAEFAPAEPAEAPEADHRGEDHTSEIPVVEVAEEPADETALEDSASDESAGDEPAARPTRTARRSPMEPRQVRTRKTGANRPVRAGSSRRRLEASDK